jgi:DNA polymerase
MSILYLDFETRSRCDLLTKGAYNYARHPSTTVLCMSYAFDDEDVTTWDGDDKFPARVRNHTGMIYAHNAAFERLICKHVLGLDYRLVQFYCTAAQAAANCAPRSLEDIGRFTSSNMRKDHKGKALIKKLCVPRADGTFNNDPDLLKEMIAYCEQDVWTMRAISKMLRPLTAEELLDYHVNERINDRGVLLDKPLAEAAVKYAEAEVVEIQQIVKEVTNGEITSVRSPKMKEWVRVRVGPTALGFMKVNEDGEERYSLDKTVRANLLALADENESEVPHDVAEVIQCADDLWSSSVAKFNRLASLADEDDCRVRGAFVFNGGSATGRASSYGAQVHNFPRKSHNDALNAREGIIQGAPIVPKYGKRVTDVLKQMLRPALIPAVGKKLVVADWSSIEARVTPWMTDTLQGEKKLELFASGADVYKHNAAATFNVRPDEVNDHQRQVGKVQELACLAEDTMVLTSNGVKAIVEVTLNDLLWDGEEWVTHQGLVLRGQKQTINVFGISATPDHLFLVANKWHEAKQLASSPNLAFQALGTGSANLPLWVLNTAPQAAFAQPRCNALAALSRTMSTAIIYARARLQGAGRALENSLVTGARVFFNTPTPAPTMPTADGFLTAYPLAKTDATTLTIKATPTMVEGALKFTRLGIKTKRPFYDTSRNWTDGINHTLSLTASTMTKGMNQTTLGLYLTKPTPKTNEQLNPYNSKCESLRNVYDIAHAGPRNRFTVMSDRGALIVHNCGFGGGVGAFANMARVYNLTLTEAESQRMVDAWRRANVWGPIYWSLLEQAYHRAMRNKGREITAGRVTYLFDGVHLWYALPSGRVLCYPHARFDGDGSLSYAKAAWKPAQDAREWPRARLWKGLACENITQAVANDLLRHTLRQVDAVLHVHDEVVLEASNPEQAADHLKRIMTTPPTWAVGLPLAAEVKIMGRYGK